MSVFLTIWHCILSAECTPSDCLFFWRFCPLGYEAGANRYNDVATSFVLINVSQSQ